MRLACSLALVATVATADRALAQPALTRQADPPAEPSPPKPKQPRNAIALSIGIPLLTGFVGFGLGNSNSDAAPVGGILFVTGIVVGPATGLWYAGKGGGLGIGLRVVAGTVAMGTILSLAESHHGDSCDDCQRNDKIVGGILVAALGTIVASTIHDAGAASRATESWNRRHGLTLAPTILPSSRGPAAGAALSLRF